MDSNKGFSGNLPETQKDKRHLPSLINDEVLAVVKDNGLRRLLLKLEKISAALYLVTGSFPNDEPLKTTIRENAIGLTGFLKPLLNDSFREGGKILFGRTMSAHLLETHSLLGIAFVAGLIQESVVELIRSEVGHTLAIIEDLGEKDENLMLPESFFSEHHFEPDTTGGNSLKQADPKDKNRPSKELNKKPKLKQKFSGDVKKTLSTKKAEERQEKITELLKKKGESTLKDISKAIDNCSKKTIQRDLSALSEKGIIDKKGSKRWSSYALKR